MKQVFEGRVCFITANQDSDNPETDGAFRPYFAFMSSVILHGGGDLTLTEKTATVTNKKEIN